MTGSPFGKEAAVSVDFFGGSPKNKPETGRSKMTVLKTAYRHRTDIAKFSLLAVFTLSVSVFLLRTDYNLFTAVINISTIVIAFVIFVIAVNTQEISRNSYFLFLGIAYCFFGFFFLVHFLFSTAVLSVQNHWRAALERFYDVSVKTYFTAKIWEGAGLLLAPFFLKRKIRKNFWWILQIALAIVFLVLIFRVRLISPRAIETLGPVAYGRLNELAVIFIYCGAFATHWAHRRRIPPKILGLLAVSFVTRIAATVIFIVTVHQTGVPDLVGNVLFFASYILLYRAFVFVNLKTPYESIFMELHQANLELRRNGDNLQKEVDDRRMVEKILLQTKAQLKAILDNIPFLAWLKDRDSRFIEVNRPFAESCGKRPEELVGKTDFDVWPKKMAQKYREDDFSVMRERKPKLVVEPIAERTGTRWFETFKTPIYGRDGEVIGTTGLARDITDKMEAEQRIKASLKEKEILLKEIHHRVKNNLQVISSLLNLQSGLIRDRKAREFFHETQDRIHSMALVHEKLYQSHDIAHIDFKRYVQNLVNHLASSSSPRNTLVQMDLSVEDAVLNIDTAIQCGLIINELVSNALKHAFRKRKEGLVTVRFAAEEDRFNLSVSDNGTGLPGDFDIASRETLGLQLVTALSEQLDGRLTVEGTKGVRVQISFPMKKDERKRLRHPPSP